MTEVAGKLAERAYAEQQAATDGESATKTNTNDSTNSADNDAVDAEFEEVKDEKN